MTEKSYRVLFRQISTGNELFIDIYSHYTCIYGVDSGEGKTEFFEIVGSGVNTGDILIESELPFVLATEINFHSILTLSERSIIMVDEALILNDNTIKKANNSKHLIIAITRNMPLKASYPLCGIYFIKRNAKGWFTIEKDDVLALAGNGDKFDTIITESGKQKSENELLSVYIDNLVAAGGRDKIEHVLRNINGKVLVIADLGNIGGAYYILRKRCQQNPDIRFYNYQAFEELLVSSLLVKRYGNEIYLNPFDYLSLEQYYENVLESATAGTILEYKHGSRLAEPFLDKSNQEDIFNSNVGRILWEVLNSWYDYN